MCCTLWGQKELDMTATEQHHNRISKAFLPKTGFFLNGSRISGCISLYFGCSFFVLGALRGKPVVGVCVCLCVCVSWERKRECKSHPILMPKQEKQVRKAIPVSESVTLKKVRIQVRRNLKAKYNSQCKCSLQCSFE